MPDMTQGKKFDRVSGTWLDADEFDRRYAEYEERVFQRRPTQGQLCAPMILRDTQPALRSMADGKIYDSKSEMRKGYRRAGVEEIGSEKPKKGLDWAEKTTKRKKQRQDIKAALHRAHSRMGYGAV